MKRIQDNFQSPVEMDTYIKKLIGAKRRIGLVNNVVQNIQVGMLYFAVFGTLQPCASLHNFLALFEFDVHMCE